MASSKEYLDFVLEQLSDLDGITFRPMMGEYLLYVDGRLAGGVYDNRLLVKPVPSAAAYVDPCTNCPTRAQSLCCLWKIWTTGRGWRGCCARCGTNCPNPRKNGETCEKGREKND